MNKLSRKCLPAVRSLLLAGILTAAVMLLSACGNYGDPQYPDGKSPYSSSDNHFKIS